MSSTLAKTNGWQLTPTSFDEALRYARLLADSELVPKDYRNKPGNVLAAIQMGADVGLSPMQSVQNIAVINGRPSLWGDAVLAIIQRAGCELIESYYNGVATCTLKRPGRHDTTRTFSEADAKRAKLWSKQGPWQDYPQRMLQMRARAFACRDGAADLLKGFSSAEEVSDVPSVADVRATVIDERPALAAAASETDKPTDPAVAAEPQQPPPPAAKYELYFFPKTKHSGKPIADLPLTSLANYIERLEKGRNDEKWWPRMEPYYEAAIREMEHRQLMENELGLQRSQDGTVSDKATGEVVSDPNEPLPADWGGNQDAELSC